ncbi:hypothetical protein [Legionella drozanskii]|uniref:Uncharacterized protein n=1 Tax=Legionella drozanskii LLAP-1 TaxID=1212489 RepID=A0A0W0SWA5_9GAMM|nr:hypothetical protein [Legionella drozanskii]KTC87663.1 hypothetical protein Ldro_1282 [Legionella drozanskii LLAP-1]
MIKNNKKCLMLAAGSLLAFSANALTQDSHYLSSECDHMARALYQLAESKSQDACAGDVMVAASYLESASIRITKGKYKQASTSLNYGEYELKAISMYRPYCSNFASQVKPLLAKLITIETQLDELEMSLKLNKKDEQ